MNLKFDISLAQRYKNASQMTRVLTEDWLAKNMYCPICGEVSILRSIANKPVEDCICEKCKAQYELKSKESNSSKFQAKVSDGAYRAMINRITSLNNPNFFFMHYDRYEVNNLIIVPKCFFTPSVIEKRTALKKPAKRAGWVGCNIIMAQIPETAKIPVIRNGVVLPIREVVTQYRKVYNLHTKTMESRGWLMDILKLIERFDDVFTLNQMYSFIDEMKIKHPENNHIPDKIRQQLQFLRDKGIIEFKGNGVYKKIMMK